MIDIVPELLEKIERDYSSGIKSNKVLIEIQKKITNGTATHALTNEFSIKAGEILAKAYQNNLSSAILPDGKMYYNIAERILRPTLGENHKLVAEAATKVQTDMNKLSGIGIKGIKPKINQDRVDGIINKIANADQFDNVAWMLDEPVVNLSQSVVDDTIKVNSEFHAQSGLTPTIVRKSSGKCCDWCSAIVGSYEYPNVPDDVYRRHRFCKCTVEYNPGDGKKVNVHSKKAAGSAEDIDWQTARLKRQTIGLQKDQQSYDVRGIKKPERPSFRDYPGGTGDENFIRDRAAYKRNRETYDELMNQQVNRAVNRDFEYNTPEGVLEAGRERGIEIDPRLLRGENDLRAFDEMFESYDELMGKYPQAMKYEYDYEGRKIPAGVKRIMKSDGDGGEWYYSAFDGDTLRLGDGMLESYEDNMRKYLESITDGYFSEGTGTYKNLFNHEFGHNVDAYIQNTIRSGKEVTQYLPKLTEYQNGLKKIYADYGPPSEYGGVNLGEFFAETFSAYEGGEQTDLTRAFGKFLEGWL